LSEKNEGKGEKKEWKADPKLTMELKKSDDWKPDNRLTMKLQEGMKKKANESEEATS